MKTTRIIASVLAGLVLAVILFCLVAIIVSEKGDHNAAAPKPKSFVQEVPFR